MTKSLKAAIVCGIAPLVTGLCVYLVWRITRIDGLMLVGLWTVGVGVVAFLAGITFLAIHNFWPARDSVARPGQSLAVSALLCLNFPVAALCFWSALDISTRYTLTVVNEGTQTVTDFEIKGAGIAHKFSAIVPGESVREHFHPNADGRLNFTAKQGVLPMAGCIEDYTTGGLGGEKIIRINPGGVWTKFPESNELR